MNEENYVAEGESDKGGKMFGLSVTLLFAIGSLIFCVPAIVLLILHFTIDISIWWFIGVVIAWILYWVGLYLMTLLGRWGAQTEKEDAQKNPNKNPYSHKGPVEPKYLDKDKK